MPLIFCFHSELLAFYRSCLLSVKYAMLVSYSVPDANFTNSLFYCMKFESTCILNSTARCGINIHHPFSPSVSQQSHADDPGLFFSYQYAVSTRSFDCQFLFLKRLPTYLIHRHLGILISFLLMNVVFTSFSLPLNPEPLNCLIVAYFSSTHLQCFSFV